MRLPRVSVTMVFVLAVAAAIRLGAQNVNLAQGKRAAASSVEISALATANAVDGKATTRWSSRYADPQWLQVDLGDSYAISRVVLDWQDASARDYRIEVSDNASSWKTVAQRGDMPAGARTDDLGGLSGTGRYVRLYCTARTSKFGYSLFEMKVYGVKPGAAATTGTSGFLLGFRAGMSIPVGPTGDVLNLGATPSVEVGWQFSLGPGRLVVGIETGTLWESTKSAQTVALPYNSFLIPLGGVVGYDLLIAGGFHLYAQAVGGYSATLVFNQGPQAAPFGVLKPYAGGGAGVGIDIDKGFSIQAGARFVAVFYDVNCFLGVVPELCMEFRL